MRCRRERICDELPPHDTGEHDFEREREAAAGEARSDSRAGDPRHGDGVPSFDLRPKAAGSSEPLGLQDSLRRLGDCDGESAALAADSSAPLPESAESELGATALAADSFPHLLPAFLRG